MRVLRIVLLIMLPATGALSSPVESARPASHTVAATSPGDVTTTAPEGLARRIPSSQADLLRLKALVLSKTNYVLVGGKGRTALDAETKDQFARRLTAAWASACRPPSAPPHDPNDARPGPSLAPDYVIDIWDPAPPGAGNIIYSPEWAGRVVQILGFRIKRGGPAVFHINFLKDEPASYVLEGKEAAAFQKWVDSVRPAKQP